MAEWGIERLRGDTENLVNESDLPCNVTLGQPFHLTFFLIMCIDSYPAIVFSAPLTERNHRLAAIRFLMNRWSCSTMLFKYAMGRHRQRSPSSPISFNSTIARAWAAWPRTLITRGR